MGRLRNETRICMPDHLLWSGLSVFMATDGTYSSTRPENRRWDGKLVDAILHVLHHVIVSNPKSAVFPKVLRQ